MLRACNYSAPAQQNLQDDDIRPGLNNPRLWAGPIRPALTRMSPDGYTSRFAKEIESLPVQILKIQEIQEIQEIQDLIGELRRYAES